MILFFHISQVFDKDRKFVGLVHVPGGGFKRPSGILLDEDEGALYVLNLRGNSMAKYVLKKAT